MSKAQPRVPKGSSKGGQWAKGPVSISTARERIRTAQMSGTSGMGDKMETPFKQGPYQSSGSLPASDYTRSPKFKAVKLKELLATQAEVYKGGVEAKLKHFDKPDVRDRPGILIRKLKGKLYIWDGHHRAAAAAALGLEEIMAEIQS